MNKKQGLTVVFAALIITSGGVAALQYTIHDEHDTQTELTNNNLTNNVDISNGTITATDVGGFSDGFGDGDLSEYSTVSGFSAVDDGSGDYVALASPSESNELIRADAIGKYGEYAFSDSVSDTGLVPYDVVSDWSNKGTVGTNASVNSNNNLELADTDQYVGNSFTTSGDTTVDSVDVSVNSSGATVDVVLQKFNSTDSTWSAVNSKSISSTGTATLSASAGAGEYRVKLVAQGDSTTNTVIESTTVNATDPAGNITFSAVDTAGTSSDTSDDTSLQIEVTPAGDVTLYKGSTQLANATVSDTSTEHTYAFQPRVDGSVSVMVDGSEVATASPSSIPDFNRVEVTATNGHSVDDLTAPADESFTYFSSHFSNVSDAREAYANTEIQPGSEVTVQVYAVDDSGTYHALNATTQTVTSSESTLSTEVIADATSSEYDTYEVDVIGHGDASISAVGMTQETSGWLGGGSVDDATSGNSGIALAGIVIAVVAVLGFRRR